MIDSKAEKVVSGWPTIDWEAETVDWDLETVFSGAETIVSGTESMGSDRLAVCAEGESTHCAPAALPTQGVALG